jgi:phytanoyl-CoA hydroxylase
MYMSYRPVAVHRPNRYKITIDQYIHYQRYGYLIVQGLVEDDAVQKLNTWSDDILYGRAYLPGIEAVAENTPLEQLLSRFSRVHMLHRNQEAAEWALLYPRVLDVLEAISGPDVLALQSMLFYNPPGKGGQGWHQDAYYIPTYPDTLIGAWIAIDNADEENGCLWVAPGSHSEPIYPSKGFTNTIHADGAFDNLSEIEHPSSLNDEINTLTKIAKKYDDIIPVPLNPGDVLFFHSHLLHRSYPNRTTARFRRAFVGHYCNARSWVPWNHGAPYQGNSANDLHILARGSTNLAFAKPKFGTPVDVWTSACNATTSARMMGMDDGNMMPIDEGVQFLKGDYT